MRKNRVPLKPSTPWLEMSVKVSPEACEAVAELLDRYGQGGAVIETLPTRSKPQLDEAAVIRVKAYLPADRNRHKRQKAIEDGLAHLRTQHSIPEVKVRALAQADWAEEWKKGYQTQKIGQHLVITPTWKKYRPKRDEIIIRMNPGMAFGTGLHPTTRLCLIALERYLRTGERVLDVGTGSGILTIAAVKLGASHVTALDIEEMAMNVAKQNISLNGISAHVELYTGTLKELKKQIQPAHLIVVNILAYTIIKMLPELKEKLLPGGHLITGGILAELTEEFETALQEAGLNPVEHLTEEDWVTMIAQSPLRS